LDLLLSLGDRHGISLALGCSPTLSELISLCLIVNGEKFVTLTMEQCIIKLTTRLEARQ
jgi:hypothetical protein